MKPIKIILIALVFYFILLSKQGISQQKDVMEQDGTDWLQVTDSFKIGYVTGVMAGLTVANQELSGYGKSERWGKPDTQSAMVKVKIDAIKDKLDDVSLYSVTVGQVVEGINVLYKDFSNRRIKTIDAVFIVKMQITGESPELIDAQIRFLKMLPISDESVGSSSDKVTAFIIGNSRLPTYAEITKGDFSQDDLIKTGQVITSDNKQHVLFCYGTYR